SEGEVSGLVACDNEGCAGWTGAEPHAWETAHEQEYAVCRTGYRQEAYRRGAGRGASGWRGALLGKDRQRGELGWPAGQTPAGRWSAAGGVLRGGAVRLRAVSAAEQQAGGAVPGRGAGGGARSTAPGSASWWRGGRCRPIGWCSARRCRRWTKPPRGAIG